MKVGHHSQTDRTLAGQILYERLTMEDDQREPGDPLRKSKFDPCCLEHEPGRICVLEAGHEIPKLSEWEIFEQGLSAGINFEKARWYWQARHLAGLAELGYPPERPVRPTNPFA